MKSVTDMTIKETRVQVVSVANKYIYIFIYVHVYIYIDTYPV